MSTSGKPITGYATIIAPDRPMVERDSTTCGHCQRVVWIKAGSACTIYLIFDPDTQREREEPGAFCKVCMRPVCLKPSCLDHCCVWEQQLAISEAKDRLRRAVGV